MFLCILLIIISGVDFTECKIDILILWDNSRSIGYGNFVDRVVPFILRLVQNDKLNVGEDGTHIGIIVFSDKSKTKTLLKFGEITKKIDLINFLKKYNDSYKYSLEEYENELMGDQTYTGDALKMAAEVSDSQTVYDITIGAHFSKHQVLRHF